MRAPTPQGYEETKRKAIQAVQAQQILNQLLNRGGPPRPFAPSRPPYNNNRPFFQRPQGNRPPPPRFNSTNAPRSYNNIPVPMDLDRGRARPQRNNWRIRNNATNVTGPSNNPSAGACFNCGQNRHFAQNCPTRR